MAKRPDRIVAIGWATLVGAAIVIEMRKPPEERTGHGTMAGVVPYDVRLPTWQRFRRSVWNPDEPKVLVPHAFGVGWTVNFARLLSRGRRGASTGAPPP